MGFIPQNTRNPPLGQAHGWDPATSTGQDGRRRVGRLQMREAAGGPGRRRQLSSQTWCLQGCGRAARERAGSSVHVRTTLSKSRDRDSPAVCTRDWGCTQATCPQHTPPPPQCTCIHMCPQMNIYIHRHTITYTRLRRTPASVHYTCSPVHCRGGRSPLDALTGVTDGLVRGADGVALSAGNQTCRPRQAASAGGAWGGVTVDRRQQGSFLDPGGEKRRGTQDTGPV